MQHMPVVGSTREQLINLGQHWDLLTILGQMSRTGTDMTKTREGFKELTAKLLVSLGEESLNKTIQDMTSKAQVAVDIVIRNLFERTADIGFLSTDQDIRDYLLEALQRQPSDHQKNQLINRFKEYVAKYSVYNNIILLDTQGNVIAQLDQSSEVEYSNDPVITNALTTKQDFYEFYGKSDLAPGEDNSLIYAYRVTETNLSSSKALGVLCLCFRFDNELEGVFSNLVDESDWSVVLLLDKSNRAIASSDEHHIPLGCRINVNCNVEFQVVKFAGRAYLAKRCETQGYQGFYGLGWSGLVMLPIEYAFESNKSKALEDVSQAYLDDVMKQSQLFSKELQKIPDDADFIQKELDRTVWNGNILQKGNATNSQANSAKVLLWEISKTGFKTKEVFEQSISELNETVISSMLDDVEFLASLAIDIMDRNLYERANDCRWWALTSAFRDMLSKNSLSSVQRQEMSEILTYINDLYTVYTNLFVFDANSEVIAVSNPKYQHLVGTTIQNNWVKQTLCITDTQDYSVSPFEVTDLYDNRPTYIYSSSISALANQSNLVGGIAIVFDSEPEFEAMLKDALPRNNKGHVLEESFAIFTDTQGNIISSTDESHVIGNRLEIDSDNFDIRNGERFSKIIEYQNNFYAIGAVSSKGYREYKSEVDKYSNDVLAFVFMLVGPISENSSEICNLANKQSIKSIRSNTTEHQHSVELATFYIGNTWLAMRAENVKEAIPITGSIKKSSLDSLYSGVIIYNEIALPIINPVLSILSKDEAEIYNKQSRQIVVVETQKGYVGIVVNRLGDIPHINANRIEAFNNGLDKHNQFIEGVVKPEQQDKHHSLLILVDPNKLIDKLSAGSLADVFDELKQKA